MSKKVYQSAVMKGKEMAEEEINNVSNEHKQKTQTNNVGNEYEQEMYTNNAHEQGEGETHTTNVHEEHEQEMDLIEEAENRIDQLLNPRKAEKEKKSEKIPVAVYLEPKVYDNLMELEDKYKKGFRTAFFNEILKKEMVARGLWKDNVKAHHKRKQK